ncbi:chloride channel protein C-like [Lytechinus variegatus]|uniref:chloride channel protein C-like n=1 Tax=Lytechinus variegatus TaxID=7654 RepID=UPI001BB16B03|nr:chloride channel protein C-like [Lytechinus variegatus]
MPTEVPLYSAGRMKIRGGKEPKYGVGEDHHPTDDTNRFFAKGRDYESRFVNHQYTAQEREILSAYESLDYLPPHSHVYKNWLKQQPARLDWDRWVMMGLIGFTTGIVGFLLHQMIDLISDFKWDRTEKYLQERSMGIAWLFLTGVSLAIVLAGTGIVVYLRPSAAGSGMPELIGFLNGTKVRHIFNVKTLVVKFFSCICAVSSGLPVGPEGPMIHMGSLIGAGVSQFKSETMKFALPLFERFRNPEDRRNFISAGAAAGVASAFGAPVGGLLFAMEEVSSFWSMKLSWQVFFCCMVSTVTTDLFNSAFSAFRYQGNFGLFKAEKYIMFQVREGIDVNIIMFIPTVVIGIIGGVLGSLFVFSNLKLARLRRRMIALTRLPWQQKLMRLSEPCIIIILVATGTVFLPAAFKCSPYTCYYEGENKPPTGYSPRCLDEQASTGKSVSMYTCEPGMVQYNSNGTLSFSNKTFNQVATLLFVTGEEAIHHLFSRDTHWEFTYGALLTVLAFYFIMACWSCGPSISAGLVVPMLYIGGLYGRLIGLTMVSMFGVQTGEYWAWMDPGAFALIGAASFFGGVSRLTMSLTVIMMEITNDIQFLLPIMVAIMVAKWVGDYLTHPLYHALLEVKCIPFLDEEPVIMHQGKNVNLELYQAKHAMTSPVRTLHPRVSVEEVAKLLIETGHGGYPVIKGGDDPSNKNQFRGIITRIELQVMLLNDDLFQGPNDTLDQDNPEVNPLDYQKLRLDHLKDKRSAYSLYQSYVEDERYQHMFINLTPYVNQSAPCIPEYFSLHRTYIIFRTLGLRHLTVVDAQNQVLGIITRKDLMGFRMEEKLDAVLHPSSATLNNGLSSQENSNVELSDNFEEWDYLDATIGT